MGPLAVANALEAYFLGFLADPNYPFVDGTHYTDAVKLYCDPPQLVSVRSDTLQLSYLARFRYQGSGKPVDEESPVVASLQVYCDMLHRCSSSEQHIYMPAALSCDYYVEYSDCLGADSDPTSYLSALWRSVWYG